MEQLKHEMWNRNGATLKAFRVLSAKVWNMDVWFK